ncbi:hypothetical protein G647_03273 [Cladophialophora carrionii CBS 160.54]|uniref:BZIP domain-containing protein n=1 Tax=Cladophialophora carrionii CBS 160.54 TaxID=1279043 RepID=V9DIK5_9EURO|nr:uncharacterized protein G647_03273 [Cladophialophora carrionii CBS 160.54]ETI26496.1 hypothetical protein G647_03273 [Cladophialophora carrionii CBS 160.54]
MSVPLVDNNLNGSLFDTSGMYFEDMGQFDDLHILEDFQHDSMPGSFSHAVSLGGSVSAEGSIFDDVVTSPADLPVTSTSTDSDRSAESHTKMRRRAQNRASQRAFRERKERHLRSLKATLETIGDKHRKLLESYSQQSEAVMKLKGRIAELNAQIAAFSTQADREPDSLEPGQHTGGQAGFDQFDAFSFSFSLKPSSNPHTMFGETQNVSRNLEPIRVNMLQLPACENLPGFEDLLNLP